MLSVVQTQTMIANAVAKTTTYKVAEILTFRDGTTMTLNGITIERPVDRPMQTHHIYRCEWLHDPSSAYRWTWFDHHEDLIAITYRCEAVGHTV
tara:strand:- start:677 stop:958 length:282 start_codon:yes stop_codon:yes gene_type:complete